MNRLKKILLSFALPFFCLLINVSNCSIIEEGLTYPINTSNPYTSTNIVGEIDFSTIRTNLIAYFTPDTHDAYSEWFNTFISDMYTQYNMDSYLTYSTDVSATNYYIYFYNKSEIDFAIDKTSDESYSGSLVYSLVNSADEILRMQVYSNGISFNRYVFTGLSVPTLWRTNVKASASEIAYVDGDGYLLTDASIKSVIDGKWDGTYYYQSESEEPDTPSLPSNAEIAQAVQAFYDSDYYKNNTEFDDFFVLYNYDNQYFSFIGHNYEDKFQQLIFPAGYKYNQQWWKFGLDGLTTELSSYIFDKYYWLYSTNDFGENFSYDGKGLLSDLLELNFSTSSTIVYSTNEYDVVVYSYNENNELTSEMDTMPGDQYTYDENLDPTTNEYNPLKNFIPTNPSQSILGDVDFDEINKTFEENKDILNIEGASWLFTANNKLVGYFIGFLSLLIVFLIISRILGG